MLDYRRRNLGGKPNGSFYRLDPPPIESDRVLGLLGAASNAESLTMFDTEQTTKFSPAKIYFMDVTTKTALGMTIVVIGVLLPLFGAGMMTWSIMAGEAIGIINMPEVRWIWGPTLLIVLTIALLFSFTFDKD